MVSFGFVFVTTCVFFTTFVFVTAFLPERMSISWLLLRAGATMFVLAGHQAASRQSNVIQTSRRYCGLVLVLQGVVCRRRLGEVMMMKVVG